MSKTVVGLFDDKSEAQAVARDLISANFRREDIMTVDDGRAGSLLGTLTDSGVPQEDAQVYVAGVRRGETLVKAESPDADAQQAVEIMNRHGAIDIDRERSYYLSGASSATAATGKATQTDTAGLARDRGEEVIPVVEEELQVGKRQVQRGGARIHTVVTERPVEEQVTLREEHVTVDRRPADRPATDADMAFREGTIEVTETAEQAVVAKQAHVVEEVVVGKEATQRTETVRDTVRRTDVEVEELDRPQRPNTRP